MTREIENTPPVSVIIPVYNVEKYLATCLDSVTNQTLKDIEIICVNDGSTDRSGEILSRYAAQDERIKIVSKPNGGLASARNAGFEIAKGKYIGFVDSDDWVEPETYETALSKMYEDPNVDFVCWGANVITEKGFANYLGWGKCASARLTGKHELNDDICLKTPAYAWNKLYKREIIRKNGLLFPQGMLYEDTSFYWCYAANSRFAYYIDANFYNYFKRKNSITGLSAQKKHHTNYRLISWETVYLYYLKKNLAENKKQLLERIFLREYHGERKFSPQREKAIAYADELKKKYGLDVKLRDSFWEKIFYVKDSIDNRHKVICVLGAKLAIRKK